MNRIFLSSLIAVGVLGGCVADELGDEATSSTEQFAKCPEWGCGENSPVTGPYNVRELYFLDSNVGNGSHVRLLAFQKNINGTVVNYQVSVVKDQVKALYWGTNTVALEHQALKDGWFLLYHDAVDGYPAEPIYLRIMSVDNQPYWQPPSTAYIETYELGYTGAGRTGDPAPVCNKPLRSSGIRDTAIDPAEGKQWKNRFHSIIYTGDRIGDSYTVTSGARASGWLNIACAGSVTAKLHLNRHTAASAVPGVVTTTTAQRQTMLKMYAGDFCGSGNAYTVAGTPIHWNSATGLNSGSGNDTAFESMWSAQGAMCMQTHRLASSTVTTESEMGTDVFHECQLPKCENFPDYKNYTLYSQYLMTLSPQ